MTTKRKYTIDPIIIIGLLFFIFGFITWLNATLIPYLQTACELTSFESYLVTFAFYISYFVMAIPSSAVLEKTGFKKGMSLGLFIMALGAFIFVPAAYTRTYIWFLTGLFIQGTGLAILQTAANPYVTILGPIESAAKRISIMGIANKFAGILSPVILGALILSGIGKIQKSIVHLDAAAKAQALDKLAHKVILPYVVIGIVLIIMAALILLSTLPEIEAKEEPVSDDEHKRNSLFQFPYFWYGVLALFFYVGAEVLSVDGQIKYGLALGFDIKVAKFFSSFTLIAMLVGYLVGIISIPKYISQQKALKYFALLGIFFTIVAVFTKGYVSILSIAALGFANSIMWPAIWPLAIDGLGKFTKLASAILVMAIAGGALIPLFYGYLSGLPAIGPTHAYAILVVCYLVIFYFATYAYKIGKRVK
ncbi:sugar MFS transporter [Candidatus Sulfidibacterium hydrothermale]|uniref:sugar MFS transporter n=1 Tax=Candidatus Sulfidibacterium hydrothermale TaxID=2875962 RepID=UPI001F0A7C86|nr:sugar MFS transporter [Candidatus Sulfidibacterium hydrothermale]UBM61818.1 sugar MFS transporter [Candidatus Sulfidibacterium hydrothermale]